MKKILISLAIILVVGAVGFGATRAYFSDTETSSGNTFTAGTLDIMLDPNGIYNSTSAPTLPVSLSDLKPGYDGEDAGDFYYPAVANVGSMNFNWKFKLLQDNALSSAPNGGNLNDVLKVIIEESSMGGNAWAYPAGGSFNCQNAVIWNGSYGATIYPIYNGNVSDYSSAVSMGSLSVGTGRCYRMSFYLDDNFVVGSSDVDDNLYQGASAVYDIGVEAEQIP